MSTTATARRTFSPRAVAAFAAVTIVLPHVPSFFHRLLDGDEAIYGSIAALMNMGGPLYAEGGVDNKPPGIFWVYSATFRVFGTYQMTAIHVVALLAVIATALLIFLVGRHVGSTRAGVLAAIFYGVMTGAGNPRLLAANTEVFMMLPLTASMLLMLQERWLWSGLLLAAAGAFRQSAAIQILLLPLALAYLEPRAARVRPLLLFASGLAAGLLAGAALLALTGSLTGFWRWTIGILTQYAGTNWTPALVWSRAQDSVIPFALATSVLWVAAIAWAARWKRLEPAHRLVVAWLVASVIGSLAGGHLSWHYFIQLMGPLAVLAALAIDHALHAPMQREVAAVVALGVLVPALWWGSYDILADPLTYDWSPPIAKHELVATYIRNHTRPSDRVFVWGDWPALYVESDREMASRFPGFLRGFARGSGLPPNNWDTAPDVWPALQADLERNPPAMIVDTAAANWSDFAKYPMRNYAVLQNLVSTKYRLVAVVDGVAIYVRNS
ncbi:MAG TPA: glycosyltransferase family 39 protein [Candidatus Nitrosopolaris sp.]|nr:glycosyltransferase family 39 protein [Candidatus Nitrosopolaris sp.]